MRKLWGPLGWMTLHSISALYPNEPSQDDKKTLKEFLDLFAETITCFQCKSHFGTIINIHKSSNPDFLDSRQKFALFVFRAHNTVNLRLDKPRPSSMSECLRTLKLATAQTSFASFRISYLSYLLRNWQREGSGQAMILMGQVKEMIEINNHYWSPRETSIPELEEGDVTTPITLNNARLNSRGVPVSTRIGFIGGRLKLAKR